MFAKTLIDGAKAWLPDSVFLSLLHRHNVGRFPNMWNPRTFNEKILHRCLYPDPRYIDLTDKLKVRDYVADKIGTRHLIPLLAEPGAFTKEVFDALPSSFVMKANHGSGFVEVVKDKSRVSFEQLSALAEKWLSTPFYRVARERHYRMIEPRIFFEALLLAEDGQVPADLKFHVFNSPSGQQTIFITVISGRFTDHPRGDTYDAEWRLQDIWLGHYHRSDTPAPPPESLDSLLEIAGVLAKEFEYVRVDLYEANGNIYFGELTFTPGAGVFPMRPDHVDYEWGRLFEVDPRHRSSR
ncbi:ATP-grasp fold amidoligase family protein [Caballeronia sp. AZ10_KS36]|uniref:ATP-grasp fold amidoligase family protein n=1 Tax=Caballeronia sp. AZ10_KS36 TaxID=2921757 RepID=UPI002028C3A5|nr:ATP-grasp fold amidoligase family protein [Caballeronia sp. AZ10_KS36]